MCQKRLYIVNLAARRIRHALPCASDSMFVIGIRIIASFGCHERCAERTYCNGTTAQSPCCRCRRWFCSSHLCSRLLFRRCPLAITIVDRIHVCFRLINCSIYLGAGKQLDYCLNYDPKTCECTTCLPPHNLDHGQCNTCLLITPFFAALCVETCSRRPGKL